MDALGAELKECFCSRESRRRRDSQSRTSTDHRRHARQAALDAAVDTMLCCAEARLKADHEPASCDHPQPAE